MKKIEKNSIYPIINGLTEDQHFSIKFKKANGEIREYTDCQVHKKIENPTPKVTTRKGITAEESFTVHNNILFYKNDDESGFRTAKISSIIEFTTPDDTYEVI